MLLCLAVVVAVAAGRPRYLIIPLDDLQSGAPLELLAGLSRQARQVRPEDSPGYNRRQEYEEPAVAPRYMYSHIKHNFFKFIFLPWGGFFFCTEIVQYTK